MATANITKRLVDSLRAEKAEYFTWDDRLKGFGVRVQPSGVKSYVFKYRAPPGGRAAPTRRVTLAVVGQITPDEARKLADKARAEVTLGKDPAAAKAADRAASTVRELTETFLREHADAKRKATTAGDYRGILERIVVPAIGARKAASIRPGDIAALHLKMRGSPYQANRMLAVVGVMYSFAAKRHILPAGINPARGIEKYPEKPRERYLSSDELAALGDALREAEVKGLPYAVDAKKATAKHTPKTNRLTKIGPHAAAAVRLLILTGARLREILHLEWEHVDFERGLLHLPDSKTGKKTIDLNAPALDVLTNLPRVGGYVIAGQSAGTDAEKPRADLNKPWRAVVRRAGLKGLRIHDLRHTHASVGAGAGLGLPIIGKLLGHAQPITTARYAHLDTDPLRRASEHIGSQIAAAMGERERRKPAKVVKLKPRRRRA
jgi:integrase